MKLKLKILTILVALTVAVSGQTNNYFGVSGAINGSVWSTNQAGPYTGSLDPTGGAIINFDNVATFIGAGINVAGISATANASVSSIAGTITNFNNGVIAINVGSGVTLDFGSQAFTASSAAGYIKNGAGVLALSGGSYGGGFTLNNGTVILHGVNALGGGATNRLTLNGGILASNATRDLTGKYAGGIFIGGDIQFGDVVGLANTSANLTFTNNIDLGASTRTFTIGNNGVNAFGGIISGLSGAGLIVTSIGGAQGSMSLSGANSYNGPTVIKGGKLVLGSSGTFDNSSSIVVGDVGSSGSILDVSSKASGFVFSSSQALSGIGTIDADAGGILRTVTVNGTHGAGDGGVGAQTLQGNLTYGGDSSIFEWDLVADTAEPASSVNAGTYDKMTVTGTVAGAAKFSILLGGNTFASAFWDTDKSWNNIFTAGSGTLSSIFTSWGGSGVSSGGIVTGRGQLSFSGNTLQWQSFAPVPESTSALAGILLGAGLFRRSRGIRMAGG